MEIVFKPVDVYHYTSKEDFIAFVNDHRKPLLVRGLDIGSCKTKWSVPYLVENIKDLPVSVHVSPTGQMNFLKKNFTYMKLPFNEFLHRASGESILPNGKPCKPLLCENEILYYRSISFDRRGRECSDLSRLFPQVSMDFIIPDVFDQADFFSSVFRIASPRVQVWTHYDVMDNILVQITGTKRVVLFSPKDAEFLYLDGDKSEVIDIDNPDLTHFPLFLNALQHECILQPGDAVFIPALWFHNIKCNTFSISINVFWKNLPHENYDKNDVYGNKDLVPALKAFAHIKKALEYLNTLPRDYRLFYTNKCMDNLKKGLEETGITGSQPKLSKEGDEKKLEGQGSKRDEHIGSTSNEETEESNHSGFRLSNE